MKKFISILMLLITVVSGAQATEITWNSSTISSITLFEVGESYTNSGITVKMTAMEEGGFYGGRMMSGGTATFVFSSTVGNIKGITINAEDTGFAIYDGWTMDRTTVTWSGTPASSVTLSGRPISISGISSIVFTIEEPTVAVTGITLDPATASMTVGGTLTLTPTVLPDNATDKSVTWTSSDESVATVADGVVTAVAAGTATITATANDGSGVTGTCTVTVTGSTVNITANADASGEYWSTFYNASQGYTADASTKIYKGSLSGSSLQLTEVTDIAAGQAVILKSTASSITLTPAATTSSDFTGNDLKGGTAVTSGYDAYTLSRGGEGTGTVGFYKFSGSLDGGKAHLEVAKSPSARSFIGFGDGTTAIEAPAATTSAENGEWYSLDGRRLSGKPARKGIYVRNGQKFIIK